MRVRAFFAIAVLPIAVGLACGDRTGLVVDDVYLPPDANAPDARRDAALDVVAHDGLPGLDVAVRPDVFHSDCPDADATFIYVITEQFILYGFYPPTGEFRQIGKINCMSSSSATPFSMAVDRKGIARVVFNDGHLYRVSTATAACLDTGFQPNQFGFLTFGMGYSSDTNGPSETLFVAADSTVGTIGLGSIDATYKLSPIAPFNPAIKHAELTGTGAGELFAFYSDTNTDPDSFIGQVDKRTAAIVGEMRLTNVSQGQGWAFAFWGGDFYTFTSPNGAFSVVNRIHPGKVPTIDEYASLQNVIVGAGVSTCAPQN